MVALFPTPPKTGVARPPAAQDEPIETPEPIEIQDGDDGEWAGTAVGQAMADAIGAWLEIGPALAVPEDAPDGVEAERRREKIRALRRGGDRLNHDLVRNVLRLLAGLVGIQATVTPGGASAPGRPSPPR